MFVVLTFPSDVECPPDNPFFRDCSSFSVLSLLAFLFFGFVLLVLLFLFFFHSIY